MPSFRLFGLSAEPFRPLFALDADALAARGVLARTVDAEPGYPCRISLEDARIGETVLLLNHEHQPADTPYRSRHAIYIRRNAEESDLQPDHVPEQLVRRTLSVRAFDAAGMLRQAEVTPGAAFAERAPAMLEDPEVAYLHVHFAGPGCYAARAERCAG